MKGKTLALIALAVLGLLLLLAVGLWVYARYFVTVYDRDGMIEKDPGEVTGDPIGFGGEEAIFALDGDGDLNPFVSSDSCDDLMDGYWFNTPEEEMRMVFSEHSGTYIHVKITRQTDQSTRYDGTLILEDIYNENGFHSGEMNAVRPGGEEIFPGCSSLHITRDAFGLLHIETDEILWENRHD